MTKRQALLCAIAGTVFLFAPYVFEHSSEIALACTQIGDHALIEFQALCALEGKCFAGAYSRFDFHQPGPLLLYLLALGSLLFSEFTFHAGPFYFSQLGINALCYLLSLYLLFQQKETRRLGLILVFLLPWIAFRLDKLVLLNYWNPPATFFPALLFFISCFLSFSRPKLLPLAVLTASAVSQHHIAAAPSFFVLSLLTLALHLKKGNRRECLLASLAGLVSLSPVFADILLNGKDANLFAILGYLGSSKETVSSSNTAVHYFLNFFYLPWRFFGASLGSVVALVFALLPFVLWKKISKTDKELLGFIVSALALTLLSCFAIKTGFHRYLLSYSFPLIALYFTLSFSALLGLLGKKQSELLSALALILSFAGLILYSPYLGPGGTCPAGRLQASRIFSELDNKPLYSLKARPVEGNWKAVSLLPKIFLQNGKEFCVQNGLKVFFERSFGCNRSERNDRQQILAGRETAKATALTKVRRTSFFLIESKERAPDD